MKRDILEKAFARASLGNHVILCHHWNESLKESNRYIHDILHEVPLKSIRSGRYYVKFDNGGLLLLLTTDPYQNIGRTCDYIYSESPEVYELYPFAKDLA